MDAVDGGDCAVDIRSPSTVIIALSTPLTEAECRNTHVVHGCLWMGLRSAHVGR